MIPLHICCVLFTPLKEMINYHSLWLFLIIIVMCLSFRLTVDEWINYTPGHIIIITLHISNNGVNKTHQMYRGIKVTWSFMMNSHVIIHIHVCIWFIHLQPEWQTVIMTIPFLQCTSCYIFNVFYSCSCHFFSSRCILWAEVCHILQSSKSTLTGFLCSIGWRITGFLETLPTHQCFLLLVYNVIHIKVFPMVVWEWGYLLCHVQTRLHSVPLDKMVWLEVIMSFGS